MGQETSLHSPSLELVSQHVRQWQPGRVQVAAVVGEFLRSAKYAENISTTAWAVTFFPSGFRFNAGPVEAMTYRSGMNDQAVRKEGAHWPFDGLGLDDWPFDGLSSNDLRLNERSFEPSKNGVLRLLALGQPNDFEYLFAHTEKPEFAVAEASYKSVAVNHVFLIHRLHSGTHEDEMIAWLNAVRPAHQAFIDQAMRSATGRPRKGTPFRRTHAEQFLVFAQGGEQAGSKDTFAAEPASAQNQSYVEGRPFETRMTRYERDPMARQKCLAHHGWRCSVCNFSFGGFYGKVAERFIHVHHLTPLSTHQQEVAVDPITDLRPVCANCHAVLHLKEPPYTLEQVQSFIQQQEH